MGSAGHVLKKTLRSVRFGIHFDVLPLAQSWSSSNCLNVIDKFKYCSVGTGKLCHTMCVRHRSFACMGKTLERRDTRLLLR